MDDQTTNQTPTQQPQRTAEDVVADLMKKGITPEKMNDEIQKIIQQETIQEQIQQTPTPPTENQPTQQ